MGSGSWVERQLPLELEPLESTSARRLARLARLALRRNPRRAQLIVSTVLGKHIPADPRVVSAAGRLLAETVRPRIAGDGDDLLVFGFAETATALGHLVAAQLGASYVHSTRRGEAASAAFEFTESHSHVATHRVLAPPELLGGAGTVVLVDDELSTGHTALTTVAALEALRPGRRYVVAALLDLRPPDADGLSVPSAVADPEIVSLARGGLHLDGTFLARAGRLVAELPAPPASRAAHGEVRRVVAAWPAGVPQGGRHGFRREDEVPFRDAVDAVAALVTDHLGAAARVHVLGHEELMYLPLTLADALRRGGWRTTFSSTTSSPVAVVDEEGYAVRHALSFVASDLPDRVPRYAYNLPASGADVVVLVVDDEADTPALYGDDGVVERLREVFGLVVVVRVDARGPG